MPWLSLTRLDDSSVLVNSDHVERITPTKVWSSFDDAQVDMTRLWFTTAEGAGYRTLDVREDYGQLADRLTHHPLPH